MDELEVTAANADADEVTHPSWLAFFTGLNIAIAVSYVVCKPPQIHTLSWLARVATSSLYILITCAAGLAGTWIARSHDSQRQFRTLVFWQARGWVFLPSIMLLLREKSAWASLVAAFAAALMAAYLVRLNRAIPNRSESTRSQRYLTRTLFSTQINLAPPSWIPLRLALLFYLASLSALAGELELFTIFLSSATFLLILEIAAGKPEEDPEVAQAGQASHPYSLVAAALCCIVIALSLPAAVWHDPFHGWGQVAPSQKPPKQKSSPETSSIGYRTIVLWPIQRQEKTIPSPPATKTASPSPGLAKPWVIPFYGPYWYFKSVGESPGPNARTTRGDPLKVNIHSTDGGPLLMEAHQNLLEPIALACCSEIQIVFKNDMAQGAFQVGLTFTDSHSPNRAPLVLGIKLVALDGAEQHPRSSSPIEQTLNFSLPKNAPIKKFDRITVTLLPDARHRTAGRKVAIERFVMIPN